MKDDQVLRVHERLAASPLLCPVAFGEGRRFGLWDLASLAEGALGTCVDADSLTVPSERRLRLRLGVSEREHTRDDEFRRRYWIRTPGGGHEPAGTIAVDTWAMGGGALRVSSLYVHPVARRRGLASLTLDTVYEACRAEGLHGFRLDAHWTWQASVRYYLGRRLWVTSWKHALGLARLSYLPRYEVRADEEELTFLVADSPESSSQPSSQPSSEPWPGSSADLRDPAGRGGAALTTGAATPMVPLLVAGGHSGRLRLRETERYRKMPDRRDAVRLYARSTLALHLAVRGRPLVRGDEEAARADRWCDIGEPEGLAYKIGVFERVARENGWRVESPYADASSLTRLGV
ncbi:GNAT family N-acetyltransferase [Streptomyces sp. NPDC002643]